MRVIGIAVLCAGLGGCWSEAREIQAVCTERAANGEYVLQRVEARPGDDDRTRRIVDNHNRILRALCGR